MSSSTIVTTQEDQRIIHLREKHHLGWENLHLRFTTESLGVPRSRDEIRLRWLNVLRYRTGGPGKSGKGWKSKGISAPSTGTVNKGSRASSPASSTLSSSSSPSRTSATPDTALETAKSDTEDVVQSDISSDVVISSPSPSSSSSSNSSTYSPTKYPATKGKNSMKAFKIDVLTQRQANRDLQQIQVAVRACSMGEYNVKMDASKECRTTAVSKSKKQRSTRTCTKQEERCPYEPLRFSSDRNWVFFDPLKGFPAELGEPPSFFKRLATYSPDNPRILEYNVVSKSIRSRTTPRELLGCSVEYSKQGPKIKGAGPLPVASYAQPFSHSISEPAKTDRKITVCKTGSDLSDITGLSELSAMSRGDSAISLPDS